MQESQYDRLIAERLKALRLERGWSLDEVASLSGTSRSTLSRLENAEISPTASLLGKLCVVHGLTMSRLMRMVEDGFAPLVARADQWIWRDPDCGFERRNVSPPSHGLAGEVLECALEPDTEISYDGPARPGLEHHLLLIEGRLEIEVGGQSHHLQSGDCLRYQLFGSSRFRTPANSAARYHLFIL